MELTEEFVNKIQSTGSPSQGKGAQTFYRDSHLTGFALRVTSGGTSSYILERRIRGKVKRITLGRVDEMPFARARARAEKLIHEVEKENAPRIINGLTVAADINLITAFNFYIEQHTRLHAATLDEYHRSMNSFLKDWLNTPVVDIGPAMVIEKHTTEGKDIPARSNNAMRLLRAVLNNVRWKMRTDDHKPLLSSNPVDVLSKRKLWYATTSRRNDHRLDKNSLKKWWQASLNLKKTSTRNYFHFLLLSGLPADLIARLKYSDIDFDKKEIILEQDATFGSVRLPISNHLSNLIYQDTARVFDKDTYIFTGLKRNRPISDPRTAIKRIASTADIKFTLRDLFQTFVSLASASDIDKSTLRLLENIYKKKQLSLTEEACAQVRSVQERVYLSTQFVVNM